MGTLWRWIFLSSFTLKILWHDLMSPVRLLCLEHTMRETASSPPPSMSQSPTCCQHGLCQSLHHGLAQYLLISVLLPRWTPNSRPPNSSLPKYCAHMPAFAFISVPAICRGVLASPQVKPLQSLAVFAHWVLSGSGTECLSVIPPAIEGQMKISLDSPWCADSGEQEALEWHTPSYGRCLATWAVGEPCSHRHMDSLQVTLGWRHTLPGMQLAPNK